jgi:hypothetical protein
MAYIQHHPMAYIQHHPMAYIQHHPNGSIEIIREMPIYGLYTNTNRFLQIEQEIMCSDTNPYARKTESEYKKELMLNIESFDEEIEEHERKKTEVVKNIALTSESIKLLIDNNKYHQDQYDKKTNIKNSMEYEYGMISDILSLVQDYIYGLKTKDNIISKIIQFKLLSDSALSERIDLIIRIINIHRNLDVWLINTKSFMKNYYAEIVNLRTKITEHYNKLSENNSIMVQKEIEKKEHQKIYDETVKKISTCEEKKRLIEIKYIRS